MAKDVAEVRNRIIKVARKKYFTYGTKNITMDEIAHEAGIGKGTLYEYFSSKNVLITELVRKKKEEMQNYISIMQKNISSEERIDFTNFLKEVIFFFNKHFSEMKQPFLNDIKKTNLELFNELNTLAPIETSNLLQQIMDRAIRENVLREDINHNVLVEMISIIIRNMFYGQQTANKLDLSHSEVFNTFIKVFLSGVLTDEEKEKYKKTFLK